MEKLSTLLSKVTLYLDRYSTFVDIVIITLSVLYFFSPVFFSGKVISNADFVFNWSPWSSVSPDGYTGPTNPVLSDSVDSGIPMFKEIEDKSIWELVNGYSILSWGRPNPSIIGTNPSQDPLLILLIKTIGIPVGTTIHFITKTLVAGIGIYFLTQRFKLARPVTVFSAISYMYSIPMIGAITESYSFIYALLPWLFILVIKLNEEFSLSNVIKFWIISSGLFFFSGFPTTILYSFLFSGLFFIFLQLNSQNSNIRDMILNTLKYFGINIYLLFLLAFTLVPNYASYERIDLSYREDYGLARLHYTHLPQIINPWHCGTQTGDVAIRCGGNWLETSMYVGFLPFIVIFLTSAIINKNTKYKYFFLALVAFQLILIFNIFNVNRIIAELPIINQNPNTRLVVLIPFTLIMAGAFAFNDVFNISKTTKYKYLPSILVSFIFLIILRFKYTLVVNDILKYLQEISLDVFNTTLNIYVISTFLVCLVVYLNSKTRTTYIAILSVTILAIIPLYELKFFSGDVYPPYVHRKDYMPSTEGISFLKRNTMPADRIFTLERAFLPNLSHYYGIENLTAHDFRTKEFSENVRRIDPGIFINSNTLDFSNRSTIILTDESRRYLEFNRVKYIVQDPGALKPNFDQIALQPHADNYISGDISYLYTFQQDEVLSNFKVWFVCSEAQKCQNIDPNGTLIELAEISTNESDSIIPSQLIEVGTDYLLYETTNNLFEAGNTLRVNLSAHEALQYQVYSSRDLFPQGEFADLNLNGDLKFLMYNETEDVVLDTVYDNDLLISKVYDGQPYGYFYDCDVLDKNQCKQALIDFQFGKGFSSFNKFFDSLKPVPITHYAPGTISFDTSGLTSKGIVIISENYYKGWYTVNSEEDPFMGFLGTMNIYFDEVDNAELSIKYLNPYIKTGFIITTLAILAIPISLVLTRKLKN